ncbi:MAG: RNA polymerase sigma factor [Acidobacteriia bacterium]|nr:RNA polymerase sigma factor [Terriglobia bacterium]
MSEAVLEGAPSDEEVVERVIAGETALYEILMRRYNRRLYRAARSITRDDAEAEDIVQEAYVRAYAHLRQFAGNAKFSTWLTRIAVYEALARVKRNRRTISLPGTGDETEYGMDNMKSDDPSPEARFSEGEARTLIETVIDALPDGYRSVFVLREIEGLSSAEAAECLETTEENIRVQLHRSRRMLRKSLYDLAHVGGSDAFLFMGERCDRVVRSVLARIQNAGAVPPVADFGPR